MGFDLCKGRLEGRQIRARLIHDTANDPHEFGQRRCSHEPRTQLLLLWDLTPLTQTLALEPVLDKGLGARKVTGQCQFLRHSTPCERKVNRLALVDKTGKKTTHER
jgi:hypothetical protein